MTPAKEREVLFIAKAGGYDGHLITDLRRAELTAIARALEARGLIAMAPEGETFRIFLTDRGRGELRA